MSIIGIIAISVGYIAAMFVADAIQSAFMVRRKAKKYKDSVDPQRIQFENPNYDLGEVCVVLFWPLSLLALLIQLFWIGVLAKPIQYLQRGHTRMRKNFTRLLLPSQFKDSEIF